MSVSAPASPPIDAIVFDLDGTLIDSRGDLAAAVDAMRADLALPPLAPGEIVRMVGEGAHLLVQRALGGETREEILRPALAAFFGHYGRLCLETTAPYPGVRDALVALAARLPLAVLTNKPERFAVQVLEGLGLLGRFRLVVGGDTLPERKPDPATLRHVASRLGLAVERLAMVGDSRIDAETAAASGAPFVYVRWGYGREPALAGRRAALTLDDPRELGESLLGLLVAAAPVRRS